MDFLKLINVQLVVTQIMCFFLILWLLKRFLWKPTFQLLEDRRQKIADELKAAEDIKLEVLKLKAEYNSHLARIDQEAMERFKVAEHKGDEKAHEIRTTARQEADRIIEDARKEIQFEFLKTRAALKGEVVDMVMKATEKMIQEKMTFDTDRKMIETMLDEMKR